MLISKLITKPALSASLPFLFSSSAYSALSPLDGRYSKSTGNLHEYFSEGALMKYRVKVEA